MPSFMESFTGTTSSLLLFKRVIAPKPPAALDGEGPQRKIIYHIFWSCPLLGSFWQVVHKVFKKVLQVDIPLLTVSFSILIFTYLLSPYLLYYPFSAQFTSYLMLLLYYFIISKKSLGPFVAALPIQFLASLKSLALQTSGNNRPFPQLVQE